MKEIIPPDNTRGFYDPEHLRKLVLENAKDAFQKKLNAIETNKFKLVATNVDYKEPDKHFTTEQQKQAILSRGSLTVPLRADFELINKTTGESVAKKSTVVAHIPWITQRNTALIQGSEYIPQCMRKDTKVLTEIGYLDIETIVRNKLNYKVLTYNFETKQIEYKRILNHFQNRLINKTLTQVKVGGEVVLECTPDHAGYSPEGVKYPMGSATKVWMYKPFKGVLGGLPEVPKLKIISANTNDIYKGVQTRIDYLKGSYDQVHLNELGHRSDEIGSESHLDKLQTLFKPSKEGFTWANEEMVEKIRNTKNWSILENKELLLAGCKHFGIGPQWGVFDYASIRECANKSHREHTNDCDSHNDGGQCNCLGYSVFDDVYPTTVKCHEFGCTSDVEFVCYTKSDPYLVYYSCNECNDKLMNKEEYIFEPWNTELTDNQIDSLLNCLFNKKKTALAQYGREYMEVIALKKLEELSNQTSMEELARFDCVSDDEEFDGTGTPGPDIVSCAPKASKLIGQEYIGCACTGIGDSSLKSDINQSKSENVGNKEFGDVIFDTILNPLTTTTSNILVEDEYVYDIEVEDNHNYFANGVLVSNCQMRLLPGVYTRKKETGEIEAHLNVLPGTGIGGHIIFYPERQLFMYKMQNTQILLYGLLKDLGVSDSAMQVAWGNEIYLKNKASYTGSEIDKIYDKLFVR